MSRIRIALLALVILVLGTLLFHTIDNYTVIDSIYLTTATLTTVGFGDIAPQAGAARIISCILQLFGLAIFSKLTAWLGGWADIFFSRQNKFIFAISTMIFVLFIGSVVFASIDSLVWTDALYMSFNIVTSVGYGDVVPRTHAAKICFVVYSLCAMTPFAIVLDATGDVVLSVFSLAAPKISNIPPAIESDKQSKNSNINESKPTISNNRRSDHEEALPEGWAVCWGWMKPSPQLNESRKQR